MKKLIILFTFALFFFSGCAETVPIVGEVCDITKDICYYASLVCDNWIPAENNLDKSSLRKAELIAVREELKYINTQLSANQISTSKVSNEEMKMRLIRIRNELKKIVEAQQRE